MMSTKRHGKSIASDELRHGHSSMRNFNSLFLFEPSSRVWATVAVILLYIMIVCFIIQDKFTFKLKISINKNLLVNVTV